MSSSSFLRLSGNWRRMPISSGNSRVPTVMFRRIYRALVPVSETFSASVPRTETACVKNPVSSCKNVVVVSISSIRSRLRCPPREKEKIKTIAKKRYERKIKRIWMDTIQTNRKRKRVFSRKIFVKKIPERIPVEPRKKSIRSRVRRFCIIGDDYTKLPLLFSIGNFFILKFI